MEKKVLDKMQRSTLYILIVCYKSSGTLKETLENLKIIQAKESGIEVHIVDCSNEYEVVANIIKSVKGIPITLYKQGENLGYAAGNNYLIEKLTDTRKDSRNGLVLIINPDIVVSWEIVQAMKNVLNSDESGFAVSPSECCRESRDEAKRPGLGMRRNGRMDYTGQRRALRMQGGYEVITTAAELTGACLMLRPWRFKDKLFNEEFYMYMEETELMIRANKMGMRTYVLSDVWVVHESGDDDAKRRKCYYTARNSIKLACMLPPLRCTRILVARYVKPIAILGLKYIIKGQWDKVVASVHGLADGLMNKKGRCARYHK
jgi:GT2 family glycosyltransferase